MSIFNSKYFFLVMALSFFFSACTDYLEEFNDEYENTFADDGNGYEDFDLVAPTGLGNDFFCKVRERSSSVTEEMYLPGMMWSSVELSISGSVASTKVIEVFYEGFSLNTDSICTSLADKKDRYKEGSFKCGSGGATYIQESKASTSMSLEEFAASATSDCDDFQATWDAAHPSKTTVSSSSRTTQSSSDEEESPRSSSSSAKSSSSSAKSSSSIQNSSASRFDTLGTCAAEYDIYDINESVVWKFTKDSSVAASAILSADFEWDFGYNASPKTATKHGNMTADPISYTSTGYSFPTLHVTLNGETYDIDCDGILVADGASGIYEDDYSVVDLRDGHEYFKRKIGTQTWLTENMKYAPPGEVSYCYGDNPDYCDYAYGRLYSWSAAQKACPNGWHLPSKDEWDALYYFVEADKGDSALIGPALKSEYSWEVNPGTNDYRFSAWAAGLYTDSIDDTGKPGFVNKGFFTLFWTSTLTDNGVGYAMVLMHNGNSFYFVDNLNETHAVSVRCLKDKP